MVKRTCKELIRDTSERGNSQRPHPKIDQKSEPYTAKCKVSSQQSRRTVGGAAFSLGAAFLTAFGWCCFPFPFFHFSLWVVLPLSLHLWGGAAFSLPFGEVVLSQSPVLLRGVAFRPALLLSGAAVPSSFEMK